MRSSRPCCACTGSMLEGGGQILRNAAALSAITATPIKVTKIRAGRSKPGLRAQHLAGLQLVAEICQGELQGGEIGSKEISLHPRHITSGHHLADTKTAGSCMLLAQVCTHASKLYKNFSCMDTQCKDIFYVSTMQLGTQSLHSGCNGTSD